MGSKTQLQVARAVAEGAARAQAVDINAPAAFSERVQGDRSYADLLSRLWDQVDQTMAELEGPSMRPRERAQVIATVARILPQLQAAERNWKASLGDRSVDSLSSRELREVVRKLDSR